MTKNRSMKIAVLVLALALLTSCFVGSTFAKYTSSATGSASAVVADWNVSVNGETLGVEQETITFNLFDFTNDNVKTAEDGNPVIVAPGTSGSFKFTVANDSDVKANFDVAFVVTGGISTLQYALDEAFTNPVSDINELDVSGALDFDDTAEKTIFWRWNTTSDAADTTLGTAETLATVTVKATITVEQAQ